MKLLLDLLANGWHVRLDHHRQEAGDVGTEANDYLHKLCRCTEIITVLAKRAIMFCSNNYYTSIIL